MGFWKQNKKDFVTYFMTLNIWAYFLFISLSWSGQQVHNILAWHCYFLVQDQAFFLANHIFFSSLLEKCAKWHSTGYDQQHNICPPNWCLEFATFRLLLSRAAISEPIPAAEGVSKRPPIRVLSWHNGAKLQCSNGNRWIQQGHSSLPWQTHKNDFWRKE